MGVTMPLNSDISNALLMLEHIQSTINQSDDEKLQSQATEDLNLIISLLDNPMFRGVAAVQDSLNVLSSQIQQHPSILPVDFDITESGELELNLPPPLYEGDFIATPNNELDDQRVPVAKLSQSSSGETVSPPIITPNIDEIPLTPITNTTYALEFQKAIDESSQGRDVITVKLFKPEGCSLGFSVVGLRSEEKGELGIFIQEIQPTGIAGRDGGLHEGDQILAIDGQPLDSNISHQQAISILQKARGLVELIVARSEDQDQEQAQPHSPGPSSPISSPSPSLALSETSKAGSDMVLNTEWAQVEVIDLINDGSGLGFGIIGGRSTGVVVKTILHGGVADRDGRLQSGDHILQIGEVNLRGMGSEQVASVLRQSGSHVRLVVARPVEPTSPDYQALPSHAPIVPTKILADPEELDRHLVQNGYPQVTYNPATPGGEPYHNPFIIHQDPSDLPLEPETRIVLDMLPGLAPSLPLPLLTMDMIPLDTQLPEMERFTVELKKDSQGLGITIAGYVCEKEELSGIFVKSISPGSAADLCKMIQVNDRIVEVDEKSLQGYTNHDAVEVLRATGGTVCLSLERYLRGPKFEQLQQAIANSELKPPIPSSPSALSLPRFPINVDAESTEIDAEGESVTTLDSVVFHEACNPDVEVNDNELLIDKDYEGTLKPSVEAAIKEKWSKIMGPDVEIVVGQLRKFGENKGLGISLEGTVDVEDGQEVRPHHYIRSILPEGPVGQNGRLRSGDELLEVNGHRLLGMNHIEVVTILKELPLAVRMVCARRSGEGAALRLIDTSQDRAAFAARSILGGSLQNLLPAMERLVKAKSDGSLASITTATTEPSLSKLRSRSLEPITGLAMWSSEPHIIELVKGERGLGFSILDYQDPMNPSETVIVIRSLVPGGVAQMDGRLIPGDRLLSVNSVALDNASLDQAVQALKGAPKGVVKIAVAKPLPIPDSVSNSQESENSVNEETPTLDDHSMYSCSGSLNSDLEQKAETSIPELELDADQESDIISKENILDIPLLENLEREVTIDGGAQSLGLILEDADGGENGLVVRDLEPNGAVTLDGRISTGDFISSINNVTLRRVSHQQSTSILDRALGSSSQISIRYIPRGEVDKFLSTLQHKPEEVQVEPTESRCRFLYPDSTASPITVSDYSTQVLSPVFSSFGCESASDKESEYLDCDWLEERTLLSSPVQTFKPESSVSPESVDSNKVQSKLQNSDNPNVQNLDSTFNPLFDSSKRDSFCRKSLNISDKTIDSEKDSDYTIKKSVNYVCFSRERSLESLSKCRNNSNGINFSELSKGVSEPLLNSGNRYLKSVVSLESGRELKGKSRMTVTSTSSTVSLANHWGPQRRVRIMRDPTSSLGISIVGGKVDIYNSRPDCSSVISGVFIKNILPNSPADRTAELKTGDRILEVDGVDLRLASHERAVNVIRAAGNPVTFLVQSLVQWNPDGESISEGLVTRGFNEPSLGAPSTSTENVPSSFPGSKSLDSNQSSENVGKAEEKKASSSSSEESEEEDSRDLEGRIKTAAGVQISRASAGNVKRSKEEIATDPEKEDQFGYTTNKVRKKYGAIAVMAEVTRGPNGLGISLAGHKDRTKMAVFICGLNPSIVAYTSGSLQVGDEIVEVNGIKLHGRCHLNASAIIKSLPGHIFKIIALRRSEGLDELSVKPITQFPVILKEETPEQRFSSFKGLRTVSMKKMSGQGLGIMIIEGRHTEAGQGIFISDIQEGSPADQADLHVGDMVLAVNKDSLVGSNYEAAAALLKKTEGVVTLIVCNPNKAKEKLGEEKAGSSAEPIASTSSGITTSGAPLTPRSDRSGKTSQATTPKLAPPGGSMSPSPSAKLRLEEEQAITAVITPGVECLIEINKDKMGLGLSIVGGSDTLLRYVIIHEIYADGAAAKDGRLKRGDVILEVNHNDFRDITHHKALTFLRQTPAKVRMLVLREESDGKEDDELSNYDYLEVEIVKKSGKGLGLNIVGKRAGPGIFISDVVGGGAASVDGRLMKGDQILSVNGQDITKMSHEDAAVVLKTAVGKVTLQILRFKQSDCDMRRCSSVIMLQEDNGL